MRRGTASAIGTTVVILLAGIFLGAPAAASETDESGEAATESPWAVGVGVRIGGYGFRHARNAKLSWADCRMDGSGVFATLDYGDHFFGELSADFYHATGKTVASGMDRLSLHVLGAVGARFLPDFILSPYIQAGIGPEWTRMDVGPTTANRVMMTPFMGVGGEFNLGKLKLGSHLRAAAMGLPEHLESGDGHADHTHGAGKELTTRYEAVGWMQFFARYEF